MRHPGSSVHRSVGGILDVTKGAHSHLVAYCGNQGITFFDLIPAKRNSKKSNSRRRKTNTGMLNITSFIHRLNVTVPHLFVQACTYLPAFWVSWKSEMTPAILAPAPDVKNGRMNTPAARRTVGRSIIFTCPKLSLCLQLNFSYHC